MAGYLPPVLEEFLADVSNYVANVGIAAGAAQAFAEANAEAVKSVAALQVAIDSLHGKDISLGVDAGSANAAAAAAENLARAEFRLSEASQLQVDTSRMLAETDAMVTAASAMVTDEYERQAAVVGLLAGATSVLAGRQEDAAHSAAGMALATGAAAIAATIAAASITAGVGPIGTFVHWVIAGGAELAAVLIPALIAFGAAAAVAAQGAQNVYTHMSALYTATEATANMFHQTIGSALGLGSALQRAQNLANPQVYSILGGAVSVLSQHFGNLASVGEQVMGILQTFAARLVVDFGQGGLGAEIHGLLSGMVTDLVQFGQILGNVGHALLNFASAMPGLAHVLLSVADGISQVIVWVSQLPAWLITTVMVFEEAWRWGGLLASIVLRLATAFGALGTLGIPVAAAILTTFGTIIQSVALGAGIFLENIGRLIAMIPIFAAETDAAGAAVAGFGGALFASVAGIEAWQLGLGLLAAAGIGYLIYRAATAKSAIQQLGDAMQQTVDHASGMKVFGDIAANLATLSGVSAQAQANLNKTAAAMPAGVHGMEMYGGAVTAAATAVNDAHNALSQQQRDLINSAQAATFLTHAYGVSWVGALALGTQAGIRWDAGIGNMSKNAEINLVKIQNLMHGYQLMGQSSGQVGKDMTVIGLESALQATKIGQLTQAWQAYMGQLTGGTTGLATFEQGLANIGTVASSTAGSLFQATGRMNESTQRFATSLASFTGKSAQNWQNFNQVVTTGAQQFISWMQTAGAMGVVSGGQMNNAIKGIVAQMIPFATHSAAARAELSGLALQANAVVAPTTRALEAFAKGGDSASQLAKFVQDATARMSDMAQVAQNLGSVLQSDLVAMFDKAKIAASGLPGALSALSNAMHTSGTSASVMQGDILNVVQRLLALHTSLPTISALLQTMGISLSTAGVKALIASGQLHTAGAAAATAGGQMRGATSEAQALAAALASLHSVNLTVTTSYINEGAPGLGGTGFRRVPFHAAGTDYAAAGLAVVGEAGRELVMFGGGERVLNNPDTERFMSSPGGFGGHAGGGAGGPMTIHLEATIDHTTNLDGNTLFTSTKKQTLLWGVRNGVPQQGRVGTGPVR